MEGLCEALGASRSLVTHHMWLLRAGGLVEPRREGRCVLYRLTDRGQGLLRAVAELGD